MCTNNYNSKLKAVQALGLVASPCASRVTYTYSFIGITLLLLPLMFISNKLEQ